MTSQDVMQHDRNEAGAYPIVAIVLPEAVIGILPLCAEGELGPRLGHTGLALNGSCDLSTR